MALEATVICVDNSEWMRNGDFGPSRFEQQQDACVNICGSKTQQNPENSVGLVTTAGRSVEVSVPLTQDLGKLVSSLHKTKISGSTDIVAGIRVAQLALRHRQKTGKKQDQRIILFVGSPVGASKQELEDLGKQLKKNSISVDIISFGEPNTQQNEEKLQALLGAANNVDESGKDNSHYVPVPSGNLLEALSQMNGGVQPGGAGAMDLDPELAWAMELSKQTYEQEHRTGDKDVEMKDNQAAPAAPAPAAPVLPAGLGLEEADPELLAAIQMSLQQEDPDLLEALRLSTTTAKEDQENETKKQETTQPPKPEQTAQKKEQDAQLDLSDIDIGDVEDLLHNLPVDKDDPEVQKLLEAFKKDKDKK
uniref:VWFA domain-containing protein n=1 Tax=Arcella intermedia TaxID=1963864 RepID=A0A6B2L7N6_9EUKA|eukprot:TRINITY_DN25114_c0_g1_i1.p1 TRINITY_DN25114_c0_g1~~TRINITY_DN25114_c0_g1_i1.p1  ORF type:complete len:376 (-),score=90.72 TRINITY_DN25114_c0_g1_i1:38-1129(-)